MWIDLTDEEQVIGGVEVEVPVGMEKLQHVLGEIVGPGLLHHLNEVLVIAGKSHDERPGLLRQEAVYLPSPDQEES